MRARVACCRPCRQGATLALAEDYLRAADGRTGEPAVTIVRAAAALYGTALATRSELRLLAHVNLLERKI